MSDSFQNLPKVEITVTGGDKLEQAINRFNDIATRIAFDSSALIQFAEVASQVFIDLGDSLRPIFRNITDVWQSIVSENPSLAYFIASADIESNVARYNFEHPYRKISRARYLHLRIRELRGR